MADGSEVHTGAVAMNGVALGSRWRILTGPLAGSTVTAEDRIGYGSQFDIWAPTCAAARAYGRREIVIARAR